MKLQLYSLIVLSYVLACTSCNSFNRIQKKYSKKSQEVIQVPYLKTIPPDSAQLLVQIKDLIPGITLTNSGERSRVSLSVDTAGNIKAQADCLPVVIRDTIPITVERIVFHEADLSGYVAKKEVAKLVKAATQQGILEGRAGKKSFFEKIEEGMSRLFWIFFIILLLILLALLALKKLS